MLGNIATVLRGTVLGQALGILVLPLLTRLYDPSAFGHFQLYNSAMLVLVVFVSLRFEVALLRAVDGRELHATLALCIISTLFTATMLAAIWSIVPYFAPELRAQFPMPSWLLWIAVVLIGTFQFLGYLVTRDHLYNVSANSKVTQAAAYSAIASGLGALKVSIGLIIADAMSRFAAIIFLVMAMRGRGHGQTRYVKFADLKAAAYKFREFPLITVFGGLMNSAGLVITPIMLYAKFSPEMAGQFTLVERAIAFPIAMIMGAVSQVYMANFANAVRDNPQQVHKQFRSLLRLLTLLSTVPAIIGWLAAPALFALVFGSEWRLAGDLARIMIPAYWIVFIYGGVNMTIMLLGRQVLQTAWEVFRLGCMIGLWVFVIHSGMSVELVVTLHALVLGGVSLLFLVLAEYSVRKGPTKMALGHG